MKSFLTLLALTGLLLSCQDKTQAPMALEYPQTPKVDTVDTYFNTQVADPYRWLEDDRSSETETWVENQNEVTFSFLEKIPYREALKNRLQELWDYE